MKPIKFKEATKVLQRPATMTDAECASLHVWSDGKQCISCWKPSIKERVRILFFGNVYLGVLSGSTQPPVFVSGAYPFTRPRFLVRVAIFLRKVYDCVKAFTKPSERAQNKPTRRNTLSVGCSFPLSSDFITHCWVCFRVLWQQL